MGHSDQTIKAYQNEIADFFEAAGQNKIRTIKKQCLQILREGFRNGEFWPSMHAAEALIQAGHGTEVQQLLQERLQNETDDQKRCGLAREMIRNGDSSKVKIIVDILAKSDSYGHVHAAESLYKVNQLGDEALLQKSMRQSDNWNLKIFAAAALAQKERPEGLDLLRQALAEPEPFTKALAAYLLGNLGDQSDIKPLHAALDAVQKPLHRFFIVTALTYLGDAHAPKELEALLEHENKNVRSLTAKSVGNAGLSHLLGKITKLLEDPELDVRIRAAQAWFALAANYKKTPTTSTTCGSVETPCINVLDSSKVKFGQK